MDCNERAKFFNAANTVEQWQVESQWFAALGFGGPKFAPTRRAWRKQRSDRALLPILFGQLPPWANADAVRDFPLISPDGDWRIPRSDVAAYLDWLDVWGTSLDDEGETLVFVVETTKEVCGVRRRSIDDFSRVIRADAWTFSGLAWLCPGHATRIVFHGGIGA